MREIKFRGKRADNGEWVFGDLHHGPITGNIYIMGTQVIPETVGQYTGLNDRDGVEIYEGYIIEIESEFQKTRREIVFSQGSFQFHRSGGLAPMRYNLKDSNTFDGLVIGNIHDNPELMEVKK